MFKNKYRNHEPVWHVQAVLLAAIVLQLLLPERYVLSVHYGFVVLQMILLAALTVTTPKERVFRSLSRRINVFGLLVLIAAGNCYALITVTQKLLHTGAVHNGRDLILTALNIYLTNLIIFALVYWEMDGGGPGKRATAENHEHDFLFPQDQNQDYRHPQWQPTFIDYLYVSATNGMAFSPTDTLPLSRRAKMLMLVQATISLVVIALVAARAVNILQ